MKLALPTIALAVALSCVSLATAAETRVIRVGVASEAIGAWRVQAKPVARRGRGRLI